MAEPPPPTPGYVATAKDALAVLREALLVLGFLMLLFLPERFNGLLDRAGFTKGSLLGFEWQKVIKESTDQAKGAGDAISQGRLKEFDDRLQALAGQSTDARVKTEIAALSKDVQASLQETARADRAAKSSVLTQQQLIAQVAPAALDATGWMYLGRASGPRGPWLAGSPETIEAVPPRRAEARCAAAGARRRLSARGGWSRPAARGRPRALGGAARPRGRSRRGRLSHASVGRGGVGEGQPLALRVRCTRSSPWCRTRRRSAPARAGRRTTPSGRRRARGSPRPPSAG
jgi:hypothetical protein